MNSVANLIMEEVKRRESVILAFAQELIRVKSVTGNEGEVAKLVYSKMKELCYDDVTEDAFGNIIGRIGSPHNAIIFDSHMDTVPVSDENNWRHDPFGGEISDGFLWGRGSVDMKGSLAMAVYAVAIARDLGILKHGVYVSASVMEEDAEGSAATYIIEHLPSRPVLAVLGEATNLDIGHGHNGRALIEASVPGTVVHASSPSLGLNAVYGLAQAIEHVEKLNKELEENNDGTIAVTRIGCVSASINSLPTSASMIIDRRLAIGLDRNDLDAEMRLIMDGTNGVWHVVKEEMVSWKGFHFEYEHFMVGWEYDSANTAIVTAANIVEEITGHLPKFFKPGFSTNAVAFAGYYKIPTIILGAGSIEKAHRTDECCPVDQLLQACAIYAALCGY